MLSDREYEMMTYLVQNGHIPRKEFAELFESADESEELIKNLITLNLATCEEHTDKMMLTPSGLSELKRHQDYIDLRELQSHESRNRFTITTVIAGLAFVVALASLIVSIISLKQPTPLELTIRGQCQDQAVYQQA